MQGSAAPAIGSAAGATAAVAERRLVTVLFADLVGFTTLSEGRDPEEVRELLSRYFDLARDIIGRHGGTVEKFIGDAVMAVWGAPVAHEDDAERGVRAGLELVEAVHDLGPAIQARAGVLTGEAAVTLGAEGQGMVAGDLVNSASRLQSVAPPGSVLVGEATQRSASRAITFEPVGDQLVKGKSIPVPAWRAMRVVAQRGGRGRDERLEAPFIGRDAELRLLKDLFHATSREHRLRLISITGVAGIGKSRLAWEFLKYVDGVVEKVWWHEGRSPAYGEGISFWALGEMIRSRADLLETDDDTTTRDKVTRMVAEHVPDEAERRRIEPALNALLGVGEAPPGGAAELFGAWRTFFERLADQSPVTMLFEDLHWADAGLLDFIDHVLEWSRNVPILIITLARPELLDRRPDWGAGRRNFLALDLEPLNETQMRELLAGLVPGLPEATVRSIVGRAEGIPLYAVETVRMLVSDGRLRESETGVGFEPAGELGELAVPESLHALIAARLDGLDPVDRGLVQDASVLGQSFTLAGLAAVAGLDSEAIEQRVRPLVRSELLRQEIDPRSPERGQYAFVQALIREVAYSTLAMRDRRNRHLAAARFFESLGEDELAGALASHYLAAYHATPAAEEQDALAGQARLALRAAADRAMALGSSSQAKDFFEQALEVARDDADRADLLERAGEAASVAARTEESESLLIRAQEIREALGDREATARLLGARATALTRGRRRDAAASVLDEAIDRFGDLGDNEVLVKLHSLRAMNRALQGDYEPGLADAELALAAAERLGLVEAAIEALLAKGMSLNLQGRFWEGRALLEGGRKLADEADLPVLGLRSVATLANQIALDDPRAAVAAQRDGLALARRVGDRTLEVSFLGNVSEDARRTGDWAWSLAEIEAAMNYIDPASLDGMPLRLSRQIYRIAQGREEPDEIGRLRAQTALLEDRDVGASMDDIDGSLAFTRGDWLNAAKAWRRVVDSSDLNAPYVLPRIAHAWILHGDVAGAQAALDELAALGIRGRAIDADRTAIRAGMAALADDRAEALAGYRSALASFQELGLPWDEALTTIEAVTRLGSVDPEIRGWIDTARTIFDRLEAAPLRALLDAAVAVGETSRRPDVTPSTTSGEAAGTTRGG
ncbi:MAG TPA: adenylate/guanylate cyclase domain-containing protein [Candidatus Limnocylindrales bacterium]|nr:adenylate/guanylate cyclase domain-containing protein [Candidatus Limnocylindrales bacterium]